MLEQHVRRLSLETDQLSSDLSPAIAARIGAVRTTRVIMAHRAGADALPDLGFFYDQMLSAYPQLDWVAIADTAGTVVRSNGALAVGARVAAKQWFSAGLLGPWVGVIEATGAATKVAALTTESNISTFGDMSLPVRDDTGRILGVIAARLSWRRTPEHAQRLTDEADSPHPTQAYVLNRADVVLIGPLVSRGLAWSGVPIDDERIAAPLRQPPLEPATATATAMATAYPEFERLTDGRRVLVARAPLIPVGELAPLGLQVLVSEPNERVYQRANAVTRQILWVSLLLGGSIALLGALGLRQLTRRLQLLTHSVASVRRNNSAAIDVPPGIDEVSQLGEAFSSLVADLARERLDLQTLTFELERRVAIRTREVERLAEESRYAAVVRERLKLARALHDTLAHSMMAIISEIRVIRRLQAHDPASVADELGRAEELAHQGLNEARSAIAQMRTFTVRETGLGPALSREFNQFIDRTGASGEFQAQPEAARFGDERSEVLLSMSQEILRNIERHARARRVYMHLEMRSATLFLQVEDDGVGFDPHEPRHGHFGLVGLYEQAQLIGADLQISSERQQGTKVCIQLRLAPIVFDPRFHRVSGAGESRL